MKYYSEEQLHHFLGIKGVVMVFSCRIQGKRVNKAKKMIKELLENDTGEED